LLLAGLFCGTCRTSSRMAARSAGEPTNWMLRSVLSGRNFESSNALNMFRVQGFGFRVSGFGFRVSGFGVRVEG
jgi:hypothetical protein